LNPDEKKLLRARAHGLKPVVITGQAGITPNVLNEIDLALTHHELIKVRINAEDRAQRRAMGDQICTSTRSELVQSIGHIVTLFRKSPDATHR
jgi:RNA-binding protein